MDHSLHWLSVYMSYKILNKIFYKDVLSVILEYIMPSKLEIRKQYKKVLYDIKVFRNYRDSTCYKNKKYFSLFLRNLKLFF